MKKVDISVLILLPILAFIITIYFNINLFTSIFLFFGLSSIYLTLRRPSIFLKSFIFAFMLSWPISWVFDLLGALNKSWIVPSTIFPFRFFGLATVEFYFLALLWVFLAVSFYGYFLDRGKDSGRFDKKIKYLLLLSLSLVTVVFLAYIFGHIAILTIPYYYLLLSITFVIPPIVFFLYFYPKFLRRLVPVLIYFFFLLFLFEISALQNAQWIFPGEQYVGFIQVFRYRFPFEELIFWMFFATPSLLVYYEFFADDRK